MFEDPGIKFAEIEFEFGLRNEPLKAFLLANFEDITTSEIEKWINNFGEEVFVAAVIQAYLEAELTDSTFDRLGYLFALYPEILDELQDQLSCLCKEPSNNSYPRIKTLQCFADVCSLGFDPDSFKDYGAARTLVLEAFEDRPDEINLEILKAARLLSIVGSGIKNSFFALINEYVLYGTKEESPALYLSIFRDDNDAIKVLLEHIENTWYKVESPWDLLEPVRPKKTCIDINSLARIEGLREKLFASLS